MFDGSKTGLLGATTPRRLEPASRGQRFISVPATPGNYTSRG